MSSIILILLTATFSSLSEETTVRLERGQKLVRVLEEAQLSQGQARELTEALGGQFKLRRVRAGHQVKLVRQDGVVVRLEYRVSPSEEYRVRRDGESYVVDRVVPELEKGIVRLEFSVARSLYDTIKAKGRKPTVANSLSDAFGWELDLNRREHLGERAVVLVETFARNGRVVRYGDILAASYTASNGARKDVYRYELPNGERTYFFADGTNAQRSFLRSPVGWAPISSRYGYRVHPVFKEVRFHDGVDYSMPVGTPVRAVASGIVSFARSTHDGGNTLCILHDSGYESCYLHLSKFSPDMKVDAPVARKQVVAYSGNTGRATTRPHLHYTLRHEGNSVDPLRKKFPRGDNLPEELREDFEKLVADYSRQLQGEVISAMLSR